MRVRRGENQYQYQVPTICNCTVVERDNIISHRGKYGQQRNVNFTSNYEWGAITSANLHCSLRHETFRHVMLLYTSNHLGKMATMTHLLARSQKCNSAKQFPSLRSAGVFQMFVKHDKLFIILWKVQVCCGARVNNSAYLKIETEGDCRYIHPFPKGTTLHI